MVGTSNKSVPDMAIEKKNWEDWGNLRKKMLPTHQKVGNGDGLCQKDAANWFGKEVFELNWERV